jgi:nifR3 family TIM-barrel protein
MPKNFWEGIKKPIFALAPMYEITNTCFRQIIAKCGRPDIFFTEFVSVDGLINKKSRAKLISHLLRFEKIEKPIVAQTWGNDPKKFRTAAAIINKLGFDGIDINMGCPDKAVVKSGAGAALILNPELAQKIIKETKKGTKGLPVSVKTRLGYDKKITKEWISFLLKAKPAAIIIHGRTKKEMLKAPADWEAIGEAAELAKKSGVLILGNGDLKSLAEAKEKIKKYKLDGAMIGRAALTNPWIFNKNSNIGEVTLKKRLELLIMYAELFEKYFKETKNFQIVRKNISSLTAGFPGAKNLRVELMATQSAKDIKKIIKSHKTIPF